jgi:hypothetical protein
VIAAELINPDFSVQPTPTGGVLIFTDPDSGIRIALPADGESFVKVIGAIGEALSPEQKREAIAKLTGGVEIVGASEMPS